MGRSDKLLKPFWDKHIEPRGSVALLGFTDNSKFAGDLYDLQLGNWDINSDWTLPKKYDTIICTRSAYFAKNLDSFFQRCYNSIKDNGVIYVDFGLGDHWRFKDYKIGWVKNGEHEYAYQEDNYLWSCVWDDNFIEDEQYRLFSERVKKFGYDNVKRAIFDETPTITHLKDIRKNFDISYNLLSLWEDRPQLYILLKGIKK